MVGKKVELVRYKISWGLEDDRIEYCISEEHKDKVAKPKYKIKWNNGNEERERIFRDEEQRDMYIERLNSRKVNYEIEEIPPIIEEIDQTGNEWFNGLTFGSYDEAKRVFEAGEAQFNLEKARTELTDNLRLRADIDYIAIMSGVDI